MSDGKSRGAARSRLLRARAKQRAESEPTRLRRVPRKDEEISSTKEAIDSVFADLLDVEEYDYWSYRLQFATPKEKRMIELHLKHALMGQRIEREKTLQEEAAERKSLMEERERQRLIALAKEYTR